MIILGIESSCDETAASVVEDGKHLLSNVIQSQIDIHAEYGGVVPEVAARSHLEVVGAVIAEALKKAELTWDDIDAVAYTYAPGLIGSLLIGSLAARTAALIHGKPLYPVHHVEAHVYANFITKQILASSSEDSAFPAGASQDSQQVAASGSLEEDGKGQANKTPSLTLPSKQPTFPMLALIVSGGHSQLALFRNHGDYELLGQTQDDAVGEAFDKVAKILGLPYPGGPSIASAALEGDPYRYQLPKSKLKNPYDFSFSGLKTAVLRAVQREVGKDFTFPSHELSELLSTKQKHDFAASFQRTAVETLVDKTIAAFAAHSPASVVIAGGVAANQELRRQLSERLPIAIEYAPMQLCTDNAAMIATLAYYQSAHMPPVSPLSATITPQLSMNHTAWHKA